MNSSNVVDRKSVSSRVCVVVHEPPSSMLEAAGSASATNDDEAAARITNRIEPSDDETRNSSTSTRRLSSSVSTQQGFLLDVLHHPAKKLSRSSCDVNETDDRHSVLRTTLLVRTKSALDPPLAHPPSAWGGGAMSGWYSLNGYLQLKFLGGGFTALLRSKRRYYFVLDEINCQLAYYKDYDDFAKKKTPTGNIDLKNSAVTLNETKPRIFTLHTIGGRQYELEAESEESALKWLECLQRRSTHKRRGDETPNSSLCSQLSVEICGPSSLPSESQLADALDSALMRSISLASPAAAASQQQHASAAAVSPPKHCTFYFGSRSGSIGANSSATGDQATEHRSPPESPSLEEYIAQKTAASATGESNHAAVERKSSNHMWTSPSASSLHFWINQWLCKQEFEANLRESTAQGEQNASGKMDDGSYARSEEPGDIGQIKRELEFYKRSDQNQKRQIEDLSNHIKRLLQQMNQMETNVKSAPESKSKYFQMQNKFLNAEVMRLSSIIKGEAEEKVQLTTTMVDLQKHLDTFKLDYTFLLQSSLRIYVGDKRNDCAELKLFGFETHQDHIVRLLNEARKLDPSLPVWESLLPAGQGHVDGFGFRNSFSDVGLALHYAASQLLIFYRSSNDQEKRQRWKEYLQKSRHGLSNTKEARTLARAGIPARYRSAIWRCLVHQKVADLKSKYGRYYFRGLSNWQASANDIQNACAHQKQITLDLMRTMPNNVHFSQPSQKGVVQLQAVLQAICAHNPSIGYCQGMNFVTAICLLFLNPEDSFWFLVAVTDRYFVPNYFDHSLTGAQADQEVLKDILEEKLPELAKHFMKRDIELATVTLNWFLALFYDSLPFETLLRIWDCFLLEGPKVLFRFVLALLHMHRNTLLECTDTMSILKALKLCAKHTYDADALVKIAFDTLRPFPRRQELIRRQTRYMEILKIRLQRKSELKAVTLANNSFDDVLYQIDLVVSVRDSEILVVYCCHNGVRKMALISLATGKVLNLELGFEWAVVSAASTNAGGGIFLSLLSGDIISLSIDSSARTCTVHWQKRLPDVVLQLMYYEDDRLFAAMANGTLAVFENASERSEPGTLQLYFIPIGAAPISCLCLVEDEIQIWCGMGGRLVVLNAKTLDCLERLTIANCSIGCVSPLFDRLLTLQLTQFGVWMSAFNSSVIQLWDPNTLTCKLVFDTSADHKCLHMQTDSRITCMLAFDTCIWVGTADGYILVYDVLPREIVAVSPRSPANRQKLRCAPVDTASGLLLLTRSTPSLVVKDHRRAPSPAPPSPVGRSRRRSPSGGGSSSRTNINETNGAGAAAAASSKTELSHRDSGYSGTNSSYYASTEMLAGGMMTAVDEYGRRRSAVRRRASNKRGGRGKRWQSCHDLHIDPIVGDGDLRDRMMAMEARGGPPPPDPDQHIFVSTFAEQHRRSPSRKFSSPVVENKKKQSMEETNRRSYSSLTTTATSSSMTSGVGGGLEYDDLFVPYPDHDTSSTNLASANQSGTGAAIGGLLYASRSKSQSDWSLSAATTAPLFTSPTPTSTTSSSITRTSSPNPNTTTNRSASDTFTFDSPRSADGRGKKSRRQLIRRPTRQELRRRDLDVDEYLGAVQHPHRPRSKTFSSNQLSPRSPNPRVITELATTTDTDNESINGGGFDASETASVLSMSSSTGAVEPPYPYRLQCIMKMKIADKEIRALTLANKTIDGQQQQCVISSAGGFDESEAIQLWSKDAKDQKLWIPKPITPSGDKRSTKSSKLDPFKAQLKRRSTSPWFRSS